MRKWHLAAIFIALIVPSGCMVSSREKLSQGLRSGDSASPNLRVFPSQSSPPNAIVIVTHGLNSRPDIMDELSGFLADSNFQVYRLGLARGDALETSKDLSLYWMRELKSTVTRARKDFPELPIVGLGYSLGATLTIALAEIDKDVRFDAFLFLAPAIAPKFKTLPLRLLSTLGLESIKIPSLAPELYRERNYTSLREYKALFKLMNLVRGLSISASLATTPCLIFQSEADEILSTSGLKHWLSINRLYDWNVSLISNRIDTDLPNHLIVNKESLGTAEWERMKNEILTFLSGQI